MKKLTNLLILTTVLALTLNSCGPISTSIVPPTASSTNPPLTAMPTVFPTDISPTTTPTISPTATVQKGKLIVVTSTADSGPGTLRQALLDAKSGDTITFDTAVFPPNAPVTIYLNNEDNDSALPNITQGNITIDASDAGVILDGSNIEGDWVNGLEIYSSSGSIVRGLQIVNFSGSGIALCGGSHNTIGGDRSIGSGPLGQGNLSSNNGIGIDLCSQESYATIKGNLIGTDPTGTQDLGKNGFCGICVENGVHDTTIGPDNIVAYNANRGIQVEGPGAFGNNITRNSIHDNKNAGIVLQNGGNTMLESPLITDFDIAKGAIAGMACPNCTVEVFSDSGGQGEIYEGLTKADSAGAFTFEKGISFAGPHITTTATDNEGNTSLFSMPTYSTKSPTLQVGNNLPKTSIRSKQSGELEDNRIGILANPLWHPQPEVFPDGVVDAYYILEQGDKRVHMAINNMDSTNPDDPIEWSKPELSIDPKHDDFISDLADNGIKITYVLSFWDKAYVAEGGILPIPRFKTEEEIQRYLEFVQFIIHHFKDRIEYYEIWNEPNIRDTIQSIDVEDYINLVKRTVPVIRQEYPEAKIVVGSVPIFGLEDREYLFSILKSDIMPLVDVVSWHPMYSYSPEYSDTRQYYYQYPSLVQEIKNMASANGFAGEYVGDELMWYTLEHARPDKVWPHSETKSAKYYARGIVMHLGMDVSVSQFNHSPYQLKITHTIQNLCTTMAGVQPVSLPIEIQSPATNIRSYSFSLPNGDRLIALWTDGVAVDEDPGIPATLTLNDLTNQKVVGIDVLHGFQQQLVTSEESGNLVIRDVLVKDYPIIIRLSK